VATLVERAEALGYGPLIAETLVVQASADGEIGNFEAAMENNELAFEAALASRHDPQAFQAAVAMVFLYGVHRHEPKQGLRWASRAEALRRRLGDDPRLRIQLQTNRANLHANTGDDAEAQGAYDEALALAHELGDELLVARITNNLGAFHAVQHRPREAKQHFEATVEHYAAVFGPEHPETIRTRANLGIVTVMSGRFREGREILEGVLVVQQAALEPDHPELLVTIEGLASAYARVGELDRAEAMRRQVLESRIRTHGPHGPATWIARSNLAGVLVHAGRNAEGYEMALELLAEIDATEGVDLRKRLLALEILTATTQALDRPRESLGYVEQVLALCKTVGCRGVLEANVRITEGEAKLALGDRVGARSSFEAVLELPRSSSDPSAYPRAVLRLVRLMIDEDREAAIALARRAVVEVVTEDVSTRKVVLELEDWLRENG